MFPKMPVLEYSQTPVPFTALVESGKGRMEGKGIESGGRRMEGRTESGERIKDAIHRSRHLLEPTLLEILRGGC